MATQRLLTDSEQRELDTLNAAVSSAIVARRAWLDVKMVECSYLQVGDDIYDVTNGTRLGVVTKLGRFWRDSDEGVRDTSAHCYYEYQTSPNGFDNTSRQSGRLFGTRDDALRHAEMRIARMRKGQ